MKKSELLKLMGDPEKGRDAAAEAGLLTPLGNNVLLRMILSRDLDKVRSELAQGIGKSQGEIVAFEVVQVGPDVKGRIMDGDLAIVYPSVSTRIGDRYVVCPEDAVAGVVRIDHLDPED